MTIRRGFLLLLIIALAALGTVMVLQSRGAGDGPARERTLQPATPPESPGGMTGTAAVIGHRDETTVSRAKVAGADSGARYVVLEAGSQAVLEDVVVRAVAGGQVLGTTDPAGSVTVRGRRITDLAFCKPGYLFGFFGLGHARLPAMQRDAEERGYFEVPLQPDRLTVRNAFRFVARDGGVPERVRFRLACLDQPPPSGAAFPRERAGFRASITREARAAWQAHMLVGTMPGFEDQPTHFGIQSEAREFAAGADVEVRFVASGLYRIEVLSSDGEVARESVTVTLGRIEPHTVMLQGGEEFVGVVVRADDSKPIEGARVELRSNALGVSAQQTDGQGRFRLAPLSAVPVVLGVAHEDFEPVEFGPRRPGRCTISLISRPTRVLHGVVRARPGLQPVAGAVVGLRRATRVVARTASAEDGRFSLTTTDPQPRLVIEAAGFQRYVEILGGGETPATFDLLPATPQQRVSAGLTAVLRGRVVGPDGAVRPGTPVRVIPDGDLAFSGIAGRRILEGGVLTLPHMALADGDGAFEIECMVGGPARLLAVDGVAQAVDGLPVRVVLGGVQAGFELMSRADRDP